MIRRPPSTTLSHYTTLFRSAVLAVGFNDLQVCKRVVQERQEDDRSGMRRIDDHASAQWIDAVAGRRHCLLDVVGAERQPRSPQLSRRRLLIITRVTNLAHEI